MQTSQFPQAVQDPVFHILIPSVTYPTFPNPTLIIKASIASLNQYLQDQHIYIVMLGYPIISQEGKIPELAVIWTCRL